MPKQRTDAVHRYFSYDVGSNTSKCKLCDNKMKGKHTSNLKCHLSAKHLPTYNEVVNLNNQAARLSGSGEAHTKDENLIQTLKMLCMQLVAVHGRPLALISDGPFRKILNLATSSNAQEINEKSVRALIPNTAYKLKLKIGSEIRHKLISLKVDSATCLDRKFFGVNIQYIKGDKILVRNLAVSEIFQSQTSDFLKERLLEILNEFMIPVNQIYSITTDNGANMKKMVKLLKGTYLSDDLIESFTAEDSSCEDNSDSESEDLENEISEQSEESAHSELVLIQNALSTDSHKIRGMLCAAHTLQLVIKDAIDESVEVQMTIDIAKKIARILRTPTNRNLLKLSNLKVPIIDCPTRWTSKYNMLDRLRSLKDFCENIGDISRLISSRFWNEINQLLICLKPCYDATLILQKEQLTVGEFYINWLNCKSKILSVQYPFASSLHKSMETREKNLLENDVVLEALYLDARLNVLLSHDQCEKARILLNETRQKLQHYLSYLEDVNDPTPSDPVLQIEQEPAPTSSTSSHYAALELILLQSEIERGLHQQTMSSFDVCLRELPTTTRLPLDTNIIGHWSNKSTMCSKLANVAFTVLAAPVTQVSVERMFSSLKFMLSPLRTNLGSSLLQQMLFIRANKDLLE